MTCLMRLIEYAALFAVFEESTSYRQVVLDEWFPLIQVMDASCTFVCTPLRHTEKRRRNSFPHAPPLCFNMTRTHVAFDARDRTEERHIKHQIGWYHS